MAMHAEIATLRPESDIFAGAVARPTCCSSIRMRVTSNINVLTREIIGAHIDVHRELGPRLLESVYATCVRRELTARGLHFECERAMPIVYKGDTLQSFYRIDLV